MAGHPVAIPQFPISFEGTRFICNLESFRDKPYKDPGGDGNWVIGFGTEISTADAEHYAAGITRDQGMFLFSKHNDDLCKQLAQTPLVTLPFQYQKDAIASLAYNLGFKQFADSTIYKHLVVRDTDLEPWTWFDKGSHKQVMAGLVRRRALELRLFIYGIYNINA